jgi:hypothetical protein
VESSPCSCSSAFAPVAAAAAVVCLLVLRFHAVVVSPLWKGKGYEDGGELLALKMMVDCLF